ncbi:hypothetical protein H924_07180 [Corynebacterium callunae DSM 20147]|uniref:Uncharacterized protein n=1 Tax=Corynebacterium callunae DSM 20147 TaxID=1121353 RepID=M1UZ05_9CORY|nr:hypothetical protein H924_07180 [Corynebacterium callunae DSM 20147]
MATYKSNRAGLEELARGSIAKQLVVDHTERLAAAAGDGFVANYQQGKSRFRGIVFADTWSAKARNAKQNTLVRVLG